MKKYQQIKISWQKKMILTICTFVLINAPILPVCASEINEGNLLRLINQERVYRNLPELKVNADLNKAANLKSKDMLNLNYFEHYAHGRTPWDFLTISGYDYSYAGENLAMDFQTSEGVVRAWMNSPTHRDNILNPNYEETGLGIVKGTFIENGQPHGTVMITNMFGKRKSMFKRTLESIRRLIPLY